MTRQCLYCAKELPKESTSNFCSKECWTEYKKLKAMNVDIDKQATVLLKRSDIPPSPETPVQISGKDHLQKETHVYEEESTQSTEVPAPASIPVPESLLPNVEKDELKKLERTISDRINELSERLACLTQQPGVEKSGPAIDTIVSDKISQLENEYRRIDNVEIMLARLEERLTNFERKLKNLAGSEAQSTQKKGFFARLFG